MFIFHLQFSSLNRQFFYLEFSSSLRSSNILELDIFNKDFQKITQKRSENKKKISSRSNKEVFLHSQSNYIHVLRFSHEFEYELKLRTPPGSSRFKRVGLYDQQEEGILQAVGFENQVDGLSFSIRK
mgnify:CR=1 FL=1